MTRRRTRGFTMVELLTVVTIIGVMASLAVMSMKRTRTAGDVDAWVNTLRNLSNQARRRAMATGRVYMIDLRNQRAQMCQADDGISCYCGTCPTKPTTCPAVSTGEIGGINRASVGAWTDSFADGTDIALPGQSYPTISKTTLSSSKAVFFGPSGAVDSDYDTVCYKSLTQSFPRGFDMYVRTSNTAGGSDTTQAKHRRLVLYGINGRPRIIDNW